MSKKDEVKDTEKVSQEKMTKAKRWFTDYAVNNPELLKQVCELTSRSAEDQFNLFLKTGNHEVYGVIYYATFKTILQFLRSKQSRYNELTIEIANSINIGYTNNDDEENEKVGNFMPILEYIGVNRNIIDTTSELDLDKSNINYIRWKELNVKTNIEYYKEIQENAFELLKKEYKISLRTSEAVIPLFCIFQDYISSILKMKYKEARGTDVSECSMNVFGLYDIYYSYNEEDGQEVYECVPNIAFKLALKADDVASRE